MSSTAADQRSSRLVGLSGVQLRIAAVTIFLLVRLALALLLGTAGLRGLGDLRHFYNLAAIPGWPYLHFWSEFPPLFPFLSEIIYQLAGGVEAAFDYSLYAFFTLADLGCLLLFWSLSERVHGPRGALPRAAAYFLILLALPYTWWYFDPLAVFFLLLGLKFLLDGKAGRAGMALAVGALVKFFPALALVWAWRAWPWKKAALATGIVITMLAVVYGALWAASPDYTLASLKSQGSKGSWETVWALVDGNHQTGNFGDLIERLDPAKASVSRGNPVVIPTWLTLGLFAAGGFALFLHSKGRSELAAVSLIGMTWAVFMLWSPGWSVQWVLYLVPLVLLALPAQLGLLIAGLLLLVNVAEWPLLLSRGRFDLLAAPVLIRTFLLALLAYLFYKQARGGEPVQL